MTAVQRRYGTWGTAKRSLLHPLVTGRVGALCGLWVHRARAVRRDLVQAAPLAVYIPTGQLMVSREAALPAPCFLSYVPSLWPVLLASGHAFQSL